MAPIFVNVNGNWKTVSAASVNVNGVWKTVNTPSVNINGTWKTAPLATTVNLSDATVFTNLRNYLSARVANYKNPSFYEYSLDGTDVYIGDGGSDMFDGGNYTSIRQNGSGVLSNVSYSSGRATVGNITYAGLGYTRPLMLMTTGTQNTSINFGFSKAGNMGADGGGSTTNTAPYNNTVVNGFTVIARMKIIYNAGDPSIGDLYFAVSHPSFSSSAMTLTGWTASGDTNDGFSAFDVTGTNILQFCTLLSRPGGAYIPDSDAQTVINAVLTDIKAALGI